MFLRLRNLYWCSADNTSHAYDSSGCGVEKSVPRSSSEKIGFLSLSVLPCFPPTAWQAQLTAFHTCYQHHQLVCDSPPYWVENSVSYLSNTVTYVFQMKTDKSIKTSSCCFKNSYAVCTIEMWLRFSMLLLFYWVCFVLFIHPRSARLHPLHPYVRPIYIGNMHLIPCCAAIEPIKQWRSIPGWHVCPLLNWKFRFRIRRCLLELEYAAKCLLLLASFLFHLLLY